MDAKYILLPASDETGHLESAIVFPPWLNHKKIAEALAKAGYPLPVTAGFVDRNGKFVKTHGESESLGIQSSPHDAQYIL